MNFVPGPLALREKIADEIRSHGPIPFSRYMELCLYEPELGYYSRAQEQFGKDGDFYTSSDVHAVFAHLLAKYFVRLWEACGEPSKLALIELGPGRGLFARDVLDWLARRSPAFYQALHYGLVERSSVLTAKLRDRLESHLAGGRVSLHSELPVELCAHPTIVFANEFFDALPVEVLAPGGEVRVGIASDDSVPGARGQGDKFVELLAPPSAELLRYIKSFSVRPENEERIEAGLVARRWMQDIAGAINVGFVLVIDYGYVREQQLRGRHRGTRASFRRHTLQPSPYEAPGQQDITAHVNFTALEAAGAGAGMEALPLLTQAQFLMEIGEADKFADVFQDAVLPQEWAKIALQLKHLITPEGMGESFQVLRMAKGVSAQFVRTNPAERHRGVAKAGRVDGATTQAAAGTVVNAAVCRDQ